MSGDGIEPLPQAPLAPELLGLVQHVAAYERLTPDAAVFGEVDPGAQGVARRTRSSVNTSSPNDLLDRLLDGATTYEGSRARGRRWQLEDGTSRSSRRTAAARTRPRARRAPPHYLGLRQGRSTCSTALLRPRPDARATAGRTSPSSSLPASTSRPTRRSFGRGARRGWASEPSSRTTRSRCCVPGRTAVGGRGRSRVGHQLCRNRSRRSSRTLSVARSDHRRLGGVATTSGSQAWLRRRGARTAGPDDEPRAGSAVALRPLVSPRARGGDASRTLAHRG